MEYTLPITGIEKHKVTLQVGGPFSKPLLFVDGKPASPGPKANYYRLPMDDRSEVIAWVKRGVFDPSPVVTVGEEEIGVAEPFTWLQWLWLCLPIPILLMSANGLLIQILGLAIGIWTTFFNGRIYRLPGLKHWMKLSLTIATLIGAGLVLLLIKLLISYLLF